MTHLGKYEEAAKCFSEAVRLNPLQAEYHYNRGSTLSNLGKKAEAIESYNNAAALCGLSKVEVSIAGYNEIIKLDPTNTYAYCNKGNVLYVLGEHKKALKCYNKVTKISEQTRLSDGYVDAWLNKYNIHALYEINKKATSRCTEKLKLLLPKLYNYIQEFLQPNVLADIVLSYATDFNNLKEAKTVLDEAVVTDFDNLNKTITVLGEGGSTDG